ncbi:MAG: hypothetical protein CVT68_12845, partial [Actinobacteria bacterium HGW-Actinobacteria-8]
PGIGWNSDDARGQGGNGNRMGMGMTDAPGRNDDTRGGRRGSNGPDGMSLHDGLGDPAALVTAGDTLSSVDTASLVFMVNEEKLAHDLYVELGDAWNLRVFDNISSAEQQHMDAVRSLLDAYGADDPTDGLAAGEFSDPELQDLYDTLLAEGLGSSTQALAVGALVEETDIEDLRDRATDNEAIATVFSSLESGSENHLRAFVNNLDRAGVDYEAQVLSDTEVSRITVR